MKIIDIILIILAVVSVGVVVWYLLGNSPTVEEALMVLLISSILVIYSKISKIEAKTESFEKSFFNLAKDFKEHIKHKK